MDKQEQIDVLDTNIKKVIKKMLTEDNETKSNVSTDSAINEIINIIDENKLDSDDANNIEDDEIKVAARYNNDKIRMDLLTPYAMTQWALVLTKGAEKYAVRNWEIGNTTYGEYIGSALRHILSIMSGEDIDEETGLPHAAHIMCNMQFLLEHMNSGKIIDDRSNLYSKG